MKLRRSHLIGFMVFVAGAVALPHTASASFGSGRTNTGNTVAAGVLSPVSGVTAAAQSATSVKVSWTPPGSQAPGAVYKVVNTTTGSTPCSGLSGTTTSCTDSGAFAGQSYTYSVVSYVPSTLWTKAPAGVSATTPDVFAVTPSSTQVAGSSFSLGLVAQKATSPTNGTLVTDTSYSGSRPITFSGPAASPNGTQPKFNNISGLSVTTNITFSSGQASSIPALLYNAATTTIAATDGSVQGQTGTFTVNPAAGSLSLSNCTVNGTTTPCPANGMSVAVAKNNALAVTVVRSSIDSYGNTLTLGQTTGSATATGGVGNFTSPTTGGTVSLSYANNGTGSNFTYTATSGNNGNPVSETITITGPTGWGTYSFTTSQKAN